MDVCGDPADFPAWASGLPGGEEPAACGNQEWPVLLQYVWKNKAV